MSPHRMASISGALHDRAVDLAKAGKHAAAGHAYHLSRAMWWKAGGDKDSMRIAWINVRTYGRQKRRQRHAVLA